MPEHPEPSSSSERGKRASFDHRTGEVHGSGSGAGGGNPGEDYDSDSAGGSGDQSAGRPPPADRPGQDRADEDTPITIPSPPD